MIRACSLPFNDWHFWRPARYNPRGIRTNRRQMVVIPGLRHPWGAIGLLLLCGSATPGQIIPTKPAPLAPQVPQGTGVCSVAKSCAELAPAMIQAALGPSPLEDNLRYLADTIGGRVTGSPAAHQAAAWAVEAFRRAGVNEVHLEKFTMPVGWSEGHTHVEIVSPVAFPVHVVSNAWTPPTP